MLSCLSAFLLFCSSVFPLSIPLISYYPAILLSCFLAFLLFCSFFAFLHFCFSAFLFFLLLRFPAIQLFCLPAFLLLGFPAFPLLCFSAFLLFSFSAFKFYCFSTSLLCFFAFHVLAFPDRNSATRVRVQNSSLNEERTGGADDTLKAGRGDHVQRF